MSVIRQFRSLCVSLELPPSARPLGFLKLSRTEFNEDVDILQNFLAARQDEIASLARIGTVRILKRFLIDC